MTNATKPQPSSTARTPLGFPVIVPRWAYPYLDALTSIFFFWLVMAGGLEGNAKIAYSGILIAHILVGLVTDYSGTNSSIFTKLFGNNKISAPLSLMYAFDSALLILFLILPNILDGFNDFTYKLCFYGLGVIPGPLILFVDYGESSFESKRTGEKQP